jgi:tetratricopeptide (TPR) repeat protein
MNFRPVALIFTLLLFTACTVYREYPIEVYKPGEIYVPSTIKNAAIVYRNFKYTGDTLQNHYTADGQLMKAINDPENLDSLLVTICLNELATHLKNNNVFEEIPIFPYDAFERHTDEDLTDLPPEIIQQLALDSNSDIIISLETFSWFFSDYSASFGSPAAGEVITAAIWGIYDPLKSNAVERKTLIDTVFWNGLDKEGNFEQDYNPPPRLTALQLASVFAGSNYARRFYADWQTVNRMYSVPPLPDFADAAFYFEEGKWDHAIELWQKYADNRNGKMAINARYNLALAYEMKDDLETAQEWLAAAHELARTYRSKNDIQMIALYQKTLETRKREIAQLNKMQNENNR